MTASFNLVDQDWIPCVQPDGIVRHNGILSTLTEAHKLAEVRDQSPLVTVSLYRLLLAVLHRVFGPESADAWGRLWQGGDGNFDRTRLEAYLMSDKYYRRFDLFDEKHPFYQTAGLPPGDVQENGRHKHEKPISFMAHELMYSDSMHVFTHFEDSDWTTRLCAEAARWLVAFHAFALGGRVAYAKCENKDREGSADAGQLTKSAVVLARGDNLFRSLMLNLVHYSEEDGAPFPFKAATDLAAWERDMPAVTHSGDSSRGDPWDRPFDGYVDLLTWQSRRVKLTPPKLDESEARLNVSGVTVMKGWQLPPREERHERETMVGFLKRLKPKKGEAPWTPVGFEEDRSLWRDYYTLLQKTTEESRRPLVLKWIDELQQLGCLNLQQVDLDVLGMAASRAKILLWRHERLPLPLAFLHDRTALDGLRKVIADSERVGKLLNEAVHEAAALLMKPNKQGKRLSRNERDDVRTLGRVPGSPIILLGAP